MERSEAIKRLKALKDEDLHQTAKRFRIEPTKNNKQNKGWAGLTLERVLGMQANRKQEPDFHDWELKSISIRRLKNNRLVFKETMAITMIKQEDVLEKTFYDSHLYSKLKSIVFVVRLVESDYRKPQTIIDVVEFDLKGDLLEQVKQDYDEVREHLRTKPFSSLTGRMGVYIQPRTKGSGGEGRKKTRAFYARKNLLQKIIKLPD